ncbi:MAG: hypothetical protein ABS36_06140 [Acidobacteria bacterium SCN 69-37]|nr:MAG: hypothetical protein ABS36_06140 [Acidobacteria bacterium SCN 69-37]
MKPIRVPKTPKSSFNKDRRPSKLLLDQIEHLEWAALPAWQRKPQLLRKYQKKRVRTEQQAAERIAQLTTIVLEEHDIVTARPAGSDTRPKVVLPPLPDAGASKGRKRKKKTTRTGGAKRSASTRTAAKKALRKKVKKASKAKRTGKKPVRRQR